MQFRLIHLLLSICLFSIPVQAEKNNYQITVIAFYNLENLFDTDNDPSNPGDDEFSAGGAYNYTPDIYKQKLHNLATVIQKMGTEFTPDGPAIIGVAEVENGRVLEDLVAQPAISKRKYRIVHFDSPDWRGIDVGLLYNPSYFTPIEARPLLVDISQNGQKGGRTRDILYVKGILAGDTIHLFVNHWPSRRGGEAASAPLRAIAAGVCRTQIDTILHYSPDARIVVMGDFNDDPVNTSISKVLNTTGDKNALTAGKLYNPWLGLYKNGVGTLAYNDNWNLFDQIILSAGWLHKDDAQWRYYRTEVFDRGFLKNSFGRYKGYPHRSFSGNQWQNGYSDHFPALIYLIRTAD